jgi:hypothetical protein
VFSFSVPCPSMDSWAYIRAHGICLPLFYKLRFGITISEYRLSASSGHYEVLHQSFCQVVLAAVDECCIRSHKVSCPHSLTPSASIGWNASPKNFHLSSPALWLISVIPAILEVEIRRIKVRSQPKRILLKTLSHKKPPQNRAGGVVQV